MLSRKLQVAATKGPKKELSLKCTEEVKLVGENSTPQSINQHSFDEWAKNTMGRSHRDAGRSCTLRPILAGERVVTTKGSKWGAQESQEDMEYHLHSRQKSRGPVEDRNRGVATGGVKGSP